MSKHTSIVALSCVSAALLAACGGSTGPRSIAGNWSYSASGLTGSGLTCSISGLAMSVQQSGTTLSGTTTGGSLTCQDQQGGQGTFPVGNSQLSGELTSNTAVTLEFGGTGFESTGTINGSTISGTSTVALQLTDNTGNPVNVTISGAFQATKQ